MTSIFSFKVNLEMHVISEDEANARAYLDQHGGYVSNREVELIKVTDGIAETKELVVEVEKTTPTKLTVVD